MTSFRTSRWRSVGASLAGLGLYLQLAFASWGVVALTAPQPADDLGIHALCLAAAGITPQGTPTQSDDAPPAPHDHLAMCCLWHAGPAMPEVAAQVSLPVTYASLACDDRDDAAFVAGRSYRPATARGPPLLT